MEPSKQSSGIIKIQTRRADDLTLAQHVRISVEHYLSQLNGHEPRGLHAFVIQEVEKPLLETALKHAGQNQSKAAKLLGISRSTLRNKMASYNIS